MPVIRLANTPLRIPAEWDAKWFDRFVRETLGSYGVFLTGTGAPAADLGAVGDLYTDKAGGVGTTLYVKESGGWAAK